MGGSLPKLAKPEIDRRSTVPRDKPTRQSLEAVRLAEQEKALRGDRSELMMLDSIGGLDEIEENDDYSDLSTKVLHEESHIAAIKALFAQAEEDEALAAMDATPPGTPGEPDRGRRFEDALETKEDIDPFGGLIPVLDDPPAAEEELSDWDLLADPGFEEGLPIVAAAGTRRDPSEPPPDELVPLSAIIPQVLLSAAEIAKLPIDPRAAFILSHVDGIQSMEEILDICAMAEAEAVELLEKLRAMGVISLA